MLERFDVGTFSPHLDEPFRIRVGDADWEETRLVEATALGEDAASGGRRTPFSLVFRGSRDRVLPQRTYRIEHEAIGEFDLFLVPIGPDRDGMRYEAVFG
ncbi:MAG TPA: hypothetical protein VH482_38045 [Thermomicrobiales bacterium]|jgi:hypothetical protein